MSKLAALAPIAFLIAANVCLAGDKFVVLHRCADGLWEASAWPPLSGNEAGGAPLVAAVQGKALALVSGPNEIELWSLSSGNLFQRIQARAEHLALHPTLPIVAMAEGNVVTLWCREKKRGDYLPHTATAVGKVTWLGFTPGGAPVVGTEDGHVEVFHLSGTHTEKHTPVRTEIEVNGKIVTFHDEVDDSFSTVQFGSLRAFPLFKGPVLGVAKSNAHGFWAAFSERGISVWQWKGSGPALDTKHIVPSEANEAVTSFGFSGNGETLAYGTTKGKVVLWDGLRRVAFGEAAFANEAVLGLQLDEEGRHLLVSQAGKNHFCEITHSTEKTSVRTLFTTEQSNHVLNGPVLGARRDLL